MEILKISAIAVIGAIFILTIKQDKPEIAAVLAIVVSVIILFYIIKYLENTITVFSYIAEKTGIGSDTLTVILKIIGIGYIAEFAGGICEDFGSKSLADKVSLSGKIIILAMSLPIIISAFNLLLEIV